ncbi:MAG: deoxyribose-phosphate aldolase [Armatimonadetes bacterium]|nr:deoxyribose-phosphate aldolase [Armatimonadota bacterium]
MTEDGGIPDTAREVLSKIDHSVLRPDATREDVITACDLGRRLGVATVCVQPCWVGLAAETLRDSGVAVSSVVGFPHGATVTEAKLMEVISLFQAGVAELDVVMNIGWFKSGRLDDVADEIGTIHLVCEAGRVLLKVILETGYLTDEEKAQAAKLAAEAGADFVKTSTGFGPGGATVEDVRLLRQAVPDRVGVKAAGGIRTAEQAQQLLAAGASRIGTSATLDIARGLGVEV